MGNSFILPEKVSIKTWTYLHLPLASQILGKPVSQHLPRYWSLTWTPFWLKALCFEFIWAKTWHLAETSCTRFSKVGIIYLDMSNEEIILDPRYIAWWKSVTRVLPFFFLSWENYLSLWCPLLTYGFKLLILSFFIFFFSLVIPQSLK